jgi:hypothetical protein
MKLVAVLPSPLEYRLNEYIRLSKDIEDVKILLGNGSDSVSNSAENFIAKFDTIPCSVFKFYKFFFQTNTIKVFLERNYDFFFIQAHFRYIDFWLIVLLNVFLRYPVVVHGQGLYRYPQSNFLRNLAYYVVLKSTFKYLFYTEECRDDFVARQIIKNNYEKCVFANNFYRLASVVVPKDKSENHEILFIGRLRDGNGLDEFLEVAVQKTNRKINIIGGGEGLESLKNKFKDCASIEFHGPITDERSIALISDRCGYGIYPGNAGLSVLHYAGLGLIPMFHCDFTKHSGPEYQFFSPMFDEICFPKNDFGTLLDNIEAIEANGSWLRLAGCASNIYHQVEKQSFGSCFAKILTEHSS